MAGPCTASAGSNVFSRGSCLQQSLPAEEQDAFSRCAPTAAVTAAAARTCCLRSTTCTSCSLRGGQHGRGLAASSLALEEALWEPL